MKQKVESLYLEYFNNFLTVKRFAEYYDLAPAKALRIISIGRKINHRKAEK